MNVVRPSNATLTTYNPSKNDKSCAVSPPFCFCTGSTGGLGARADDDGDSDANDNDNGCCVTDGAGGAADCPFNGGDPKLCVDNTSPSPNKSISLLNDPKANGNGSGGGNGGGVGCTNDGDGDGHRPRCFSACSSKLCVRWWMDKPDLELVIPPASLPLRTLEGFAGTGGGEGVRICDCNCEDEDDVTKSSKSSNDMDVTDLEELSACAEDGEPMEESMDSRGSGKVVWRGREENAENESSSSSPSL